MGMLVNGFWHDGDPPTAAADGSFVRLESGFRDRVTRDGSSRFKAEAGRYQLVTAPSCPWAHRTVLMRMLNSEFDDFGNAALDLYPEALRSAIDETNTFVYDAINNGVYRCGFAGTQAAYEQSFRKLFAALDSIEQRLGGQRYLVGDQFTEADLRLFPTLVRFAAVYYGHFKCNLRRLADYHNLSNYTRDIYQLPGVAETVDIPRIKLVY